MEKSSEVNCIRNYSLNIPQMLSGGMSENWLLKELGDIHWEMISKSLNTKSDEIIDSNGNRLYASFVRLQWSANNSLFAFKENEALLVKGELSLYGNKMYFSKDRITCSDKSISASLMSVFSSRKLENNEKLVKGKPLNATTSKVKKYRKLPKFAKVFFETKNFLFPEKENQKSGTIDFYKTSFNIKKEAIFSKLYYVDPYDDINGVGLLYFASYSKISDKCERFYFQELYADKEDHTDYNWAEKSSCIARDIHFYGNSNAGEELLYCLEDYSFIGQNKVKITSSLHRTKEKQLIAKIFTVKELLHPAILIPKSENKKNQRIKDAITSNNKIVYKREDAKEYRIYNSHISRNVIGDEATYTKEELNTIVIDFLSTMFSEQPIEESTDLRQVGIESIIFAELSEHLNTTYGLKSNPSRFFGCYNVVQIVSYLLGNSNPVKEEVKNKEKGILSDDIAVIGISFRVPGATNKQEFWDILSNNKSEIITTPEERFTWPDWIDLKNKDKGIDYGGYIKDIDKFDAYFFGISPQEAALMDPQHRIVLEAMHAALEDAAIVPKSLDGSNTGVFIGVSGSDYAHILRQEDKEVTASYNAIGTSNAILANRISYLLNLHGPSEAIDTACSSSLVALHRGIKHIQEGSCDVVITGGVNALLSPELTISYNQTGMLSSDGSCKTFDQGANGYVRSEGVGVVILKSLKKAEEDGDPIYAVIKGSAINHGGSANTLTSPNPEAQKALLVQAYNSANIDPRKVGYIEAHGTGTPLGDPIEIEGIKLAFEELYKIHNLEHPESPYCGIGSVKTNLGHLEAAAGITGIIKVLLSLQHKMLPGNPHLKNTNKYIELENSPFYLRKETSTWDVPKGSKRIAGVSSFGFGGVNAHIVLEEYNNKRIPYKGEASAIILLSAKNQQRLKDQVKNLLAYMQVNEAVNLNDVAFTLQVGRGFMEERIAIIADNTKHLTSQLNDYLLENELNDVREKDSDVQNREDKKLSVQNASVPRSCANPVGANPTRVIDCSL